MTGESRALTNNNVNQHFKDHFTLGIGVLRLRCGTSRGVRLSASKTQGVQSRFADISLDNSTGLCDYVS